MPSETVPAISATPVTAAEIPTPSPTPPDTAARDARTGSRSALLRYMRAQRA